MSIVRLPRGGTRRMINKFTANTDMRFDDSVLAEGTAARVENFDVTGGALTDGWGISSDPRVHAVSATSR